MEFLTKPEDQMEPNEITLEERNTILEALLAKVPIDIFTTPGKESLYLLKQKEPLPPDVKTINIVVKLLDPVMFPIQAKNTKKMLNDLRTSGLLNDVIGLNIKGTVRKYNREEKKKLYPVKEGKKSRYEVNVYDVVPKCHDIYAYVLPHGEYVLLYHIRGRWFRALSYFNNHYFYSHFLSIYFSNTYYYTKVKMVL